MPGPGNNDTPEITVTLTPQEAAEGGVVAVPWAGGDLQVAVPPARHGERVRVRIAGQDVVLRIRVAGPAAGRSPAPAPASGTARGARVGACLGVLVVTACLAFIGYLISLVVQGTSSSSAGSAGSSPSAAWSPSPAESASPDPYSSDPYSSDPYGSDPYGAESESPAPDPYDSGTCLNGELPNSETAQSVSGVDEVSCSASDAHYKVIETIPLTSDLSRCRSNPRTEYAFSHRYTLNGATINEYVYCLVGLGSYARS